MPVSIMRRGNKAIVSLAFPWSNESGHLTISVAPRNRKSEDGRVMTIKKTNAAKGENTSINADVWDVALSWFSLTSA